MPECAGCPRRRRQCVRRRLRRLDHGAGRYRGSLPATRRANGRVATIAVNSFVFKNPVFVGDLLSFYADIVKVGNTSITVNVEVYAERNRLQACIVKVTEATLIYVATDSDRKPRKVPPIETLLSS